MSPESLEPELLEMEAELRALKPLDADFTILNRISLAMEPTLSVVPNTVGRSNSGSKTHSETNVVGAAARYWKPAAIAAAACAVGVPTGMWINEKQHNGVIGQVVEANKASSKGVARIESMIPSNYQLIGHYTEPSKEVSAPRAVSNVSVGGSSTRKVSVKEVYLYLNPENGDQLRYEVPRQIEVPVAPY